MHNKNTSIYFEHFQQDREFGVEQYLGTFSEVHKYRRMHIEKWSGTVHELHAEMLQTRFEH